MTMISPDETHKLKQLAHEAARNDLFAYMRLALPVVEPAAKFVPALHLKVISHHLELVERGDIRKLVIAVAPRHFKSFAASVAFVTWLLGRHPSMKIICGSYGHELANEFAFQSRRIMLSGAYRDIFTTRLDPKGQALGELRTTANGRRFSTSVDGAATGKGADIIIVDDPLKAGDAHSEPAKERAFSWIKETLTSRFDDPANGRMVVLMQRLALDDPIGRLMEEDGWTALILPAMARKDMNIPIAKEEKWYLNAGELLFPERFDAKKLKEWKHDLGTDAFNTQVLQQPTPPGGATFKLEWFQRYKTTPFSKFETIIQSWDTALTDSETACFNVCTTWGIVGKRLYLLDVYRARHEYHELEKKVREMKTAWRADSVVVEYAGSGLVLYNNIRRDPDGGWIYNITPKIGKFERAMMQVPKLERGRVYIPESAAWLDSFLKEVLEFPNSKYNDQVDSFIQFLHIFDYGKSTPVKELSMFNGWYGGASPI